MANILLVVFEINGEEYGVNALAVNGILRHQKFKIHRVPGMPEHIEGMIDLRGRVNYIFNLGILFGIGKSTLRDESKFMMLNIKNSIAGFIVDEVTDVVSIAEDTIQEPPAFTSGIKAGYFLGIARINDHLIIMLNPDKLLSEDPDQLALLAQ